LQSIQILSILNDIITQTSYLQMSLKLGMKHLAYLQENTTGREGDILPKFG
jgi:hypothetical protein